MGTLLVSYGHGDEVLNSEGTEGVLLGVPVAHGAVVGRFLAALSGSDAGRKIAQGAVGNSGTAVHFLKVELDHSLAHQLGKAVKLPGFLEGVTPRDDGGHKDVVSIAHDSHAET